MNMTLYENESNSTFDEEVIKTIESNLHDMVGYDVIVDDLCNDISQGENADGFWILGTYESMEFLGKYRWEAAEMFDDVLRDWCDFNPFSNPETFVTLMFIQRSSELISSAQWVIDNEGETVRLTNEMVSDIVRDLNNIISSEE